MLTTRPPKPSYNEVNMFLLIPKQQSAYFNSSPPSLLDILIHIILQDMACHGDERRRIIMCIFNSHQDIRLNKPT